MEPACVAAIATLEALLHDDVLYLGGGNVRRLTVDLPAGVRTASNDNGITGGIHLWNESIWLGIRGNRSRYHLANRSHGDNVDHHEGRGSGCPVERRMAPGERLARW